MIPFLTGTGKTRVLKYPLPPDLPLAGRGHLVSFITDVSPKLKGIPRLAHPRFFPAGLRSRSRWRARPLDLDLRNPARGAKIPGYWNPWLPGILHYPIPICIIVV